MRIVVHEPTVEAPEEASAVATAVLAALVTELRVLSDGDLSAGGSAGDAGPRRDPTD